MQFMGPPEPQPEAEPEPEAEAEAEAAAAAAAAAAPPVADQEALAKSTQPAVLAINAAAVSLTKDLTDHMKDGLQLSGEFREIGGQHMFDLKQGACSVKEKKAAAADGSDGDSSAAEWEWNDLRETARIGVSQQT